MEIQPKTLYLVGTPIGNLGDMSLRAAQTLRDVSFVAAEDTRVTRKLFSHFDIHVPLISYHQHNRAESGQKIVARLIGGESAALVTDAGMPAISDPGQDLVALCAEASVNVVVVPGPSAVVGAVALSGLPSGRFCFEGFLSTARHSRREHLAEIRHETRTMVFYEAPHKLLSTLQDLLEVLGDRKISLTREMTKFHEEVLRMTLSQAIEHYTDNPPRGEFVLVIEGAAPPPPRDRQEEAFARGQAYVETGLSVRDAARLAAGETDTSRSTLYKYLLSLG